jgi:hypothetical protein
MILINNRKVFYMKLIKLLSEEFPMFDNFADDSLEGGENPTGLAPEGEDNAGLEDQCQCQCTCPCCQGKKDDQGLVDDGQNLDFSANQPGANLEDPTGSDDEFDFKV